MARYLEIKQDNGSVLIDDSTTRLCLRRYGTLWDLASKLSVNTYSYYGGGDPDSDRRCVTAAQLTVPLLDEEILVGFKLTVNDFGTCFNYSRKSKNEMLVNLYSSPSGLHSSSDNSSIEALCKSIILCTFSDNVTAINRFGLEVFNAQGERIFNSSEKLLQIIGKHDREYNFFGINFNSLPLSFVALENANNAIVIPNQFLSGWTRSPNSGRLPYPSVYGIAFANNTIYLRLIVTAGSFGDYDWTGGQSANASCIFADGTYLK